MDDDEDQRDVELSSLTAIYPEIQRLSDDDPYTFTLDLPIKPAKPVAVFFPAVTAGHSLDDIAPQPAAADATNGQIDSHEIAHLPAIRLQISLPPSYPKEKPPAVTVSTNPSWLTSTTVKALEGECERLWEDLGRDLVVFSFIDHVQQLADDVFGLVSDAGALEIQPEHKIGVLAYDIEEKRRVFDNETFFCGVCLGRSLTSSLFLCTTSPTHKACVWIRWEGRHLSCVAFAVMLVLAADRMEPDSHKFSVPNIPQLGVTGLAYCGRARYIFCFIIRDVLLTLMLRSKEGS